MRTSKFLATSAAAIAVGGLTAVGSAMSLPVAAAASSSGVTTSQWQHTRTVTMSQLAPASNAPLSPQAQAVVARVSRAVNRSLSAHPSANSRDVVAGFAPPVVAPTAVGGTTPRPTASWEGINAYTMSQAEGATFTPPDQGMCAGNGFVLEIVNNAVRIYQANGTPASPTVASNAFFGLPPLVNATTGRFGPEPTDPTCTYDSSIGRWFVDEVVLSINSTTGALTLVNKATLAVSRTSNPLGTYDIYTLNLTDTHAGGMHVNCPCLGDFPKIAVDSHGLYLTTNEYPWIGAGFYGNGYNGAQIYAASKNKLAAGLASVPVEHFNNTSLSSAGGSVPGFTVWPAAVPGNAFATANNGSEYFVSSTAGAEANPTNFTGFSNTIGMYSLSNTASLDSAHPALSLKDALLSSEVYGEAPLAAQKLGPVPLRDCLAVQCFTGIGPSNEQEGSLDPSDTRPLTVWYANGQLLMALDTVMQVKGNLQAGPAWFSINPSTSPSAAHLLAQGYIGIAGNNAIYPSIATGPTGLGVMDIAIAGRDFYPTQGYLMWGAGGPASSIAIAAPGAAPLDDFCEYNFFDCSGASTPVARPRYGDYSWATFMNGAVYIAGEDVSSNCSFAQFKTDPTCGGTRSPYSNWSTRISAITP
jgi:hypothetical protein